MILFLGLINSALQPTVSFKQPLLKYKNIGL